MGFKITFVIGGDRSGKSSFALKEASKIDGQKAFIATAEALDDEMQERIETHKKERGNDWDTYEEPLNISGVLSEIKGRYKIIVLDCLTLWLSNVLLRTKNKEQRTQTTKKSIQELIDELKSFKNSSRITNHLPAGRQGVSRLYIVSNVIGMGIVPDNSLAREFRDLTGFLNQKIAEVADEVYMVAAGIPVKIK